MGAAVLPAALAAGSSLLSGGLSLLGGKLARDFEARQAQKQMDFQERMSGSAYQRATADMKLAGINPALSFMQGGATSPSGAMASGEDIISPAVSSAQGTMRLIKELELLDAQALKTRKDASLSQQLALKAGQETTNISRGAGDESFDVLIKEATLANLGVTRENIMAETKLRKLAMPGAAVTGGKLAAWARTIFGGAGPVIGAAAAAKAIP